MAVYVDDFAASFLGMIMCHMIADTHDELMTMADEVGVQRKWLQQPGTRHEHFDVCRAKRKLAVRAGAIELSSKDLARKGMEVHARSGEASYYRTGGPSSLPAPANSISPIPDAE